MMITMLIIKPDLIAHFHDGVIQNANHEGFWESLLAILRLCLMSNCIMGMFYGTQSRYKMTQSSPKIVPKCNST